MLASMVFPLVQLIMLGNAFGGKIQDARMGVVDEDHGTAGAAHSRGVRLGCRQRQHLQAHLLRQTTSGRRKMCAPARLEGAVIIPPQFSSKFYEQNIHGSGWWWITRTSS